MSIPGKSDDTFAEQVTGLFPIRTVATLTGVNPVTLRAWERRYGLITPKRSTKGHRLYSQKDVEQLQRITALLNQGIAISQIKALLNQSPIPANDNPRSTTNQIVKYTWDHYLEIMLNAIDDFDEHCLDAIYNDVLSLYPIDIISLHLIKPLWEILGKQWKHSDSGIAKEHFFSLFVRNKLGTRIQHLNQRTSGPVLLIACLPGEQHETSMLLFALAALNHNYRTLLLGANLPLAQIPAILNKRACDAVVLSGFTRPTKGLFEKLLPQLIAEVRIPVFAGGTLAQRYETEIKATQAIYAGPDINHGLKIIRSHIKTSRARIKSS